MIACAALAATGAVIAWLMIDTDALEAEPSAAGSPEAVPADFACGRTPLAISDQASLTCRARARPDCGSQEQAVSRQQARSLGADLRLAPALLGAGGENASATRACGAWRVASSFVSKVEVEYIEPEPLPEGLDDRRLRRRAVRIAAVLVVVGLVAAFAPGLGEVRDRLAGRARAGSRSPCCSSCCRACPTC